MAVVQTLSTIKVQSIINYVRTHIALKTLLGVGGFALEPGMSIANDVLQFILAKPFSWKFNRKDLAFFVTQPFVQDYFFAGAGAFTISPLVGTGTANVGGGGVGVDLATNNGITQSGSTVTVNCLQRHNYVAGQTVYFNNVVDQSGNLVTALNAILTVNTNAATATWSNGFVITAIPTGTSFQFTLAAPINISGAPGIFDFGWLEAASLTDYSNTSVPQPTGPIEAADRITPSSLVGEPAKVAAYRDLGTGVLVFRVDPCATSYNMAVNLTYQARARLLTSPNDNWAPWPDNLAYVLRSGFKAYALDLFGNSESGKVRAMQKFLMDVQSAKEYEDSEESNLGFAPRMPLMRG
jgi:hypothetical protein